MGKNTGKVREFCQSGKVGTMLNDIKQFSRKYNSGRSQMN